MSSPFGPRRSDNDDETGAGAADDVDDAADESCCSTWGTVEVEASCVIVDAVVCAALPAGVPFAFLTASACWVTPAKLVVEAGGTNGAIVVAADDAPA
jgi:hypothetical protein